MDSGENNNNNDDNNTTVILDNNSTGILAAGGKVCCVSALSCDSRLRCLFGQSHRCEIDLISSVEWDTAC